MKVRNIVRKAASLAAGATVFGATFMGALAVDLADFPANMIEGGNFDGKIIIGERAASADVVGAIDIAASLQASSTVEVPVPGAAGEIGLAGENYELSTGSDLVELREPIGQVVDTITSGELPGLKSGRLTTSEGDTDYHQYLRLRDGSNLQNMTVNYVEDDNDNVGPFLVVDTDSPFLEWEIQFPEGLESELSSGELDDLEDKSFNIMGTDFTIVRATLDTDGTDFEATLMGGSIADTLREGETRVYSIDGVDYEVTLVFVSDPNSGTVESKFSVNGELTQALEEGDTDTLSGGLQIGVRDILVNAREGVASFFLGADKLVITDASTNVADDFSGTIKINNENINDGEITLLGSFTSSANTTFEITSIKYRLTMDADDGTTAFVPPGHGVREFMDRPESLISDSLDVFFGGLTAPETTPVEFKPKSDDEYRMTFTNVQGQTYTFPVLSNSAGVWKFGDDDDELIFVEGTSAANYVIGREDYFIVSNDRGAGDADKSVTNVLRYEDYDNTDFRVELEDLSTGSTVNVPIATDGTGSLVVGGHTYSVNVSSRTAAEPNLSVDLNADGGYSDVVSITTWGGLIIDLANEIATNTSAGGVNATSTNATIMQEIVGNGLTIEDASLYNIADGSGSVEFEGTVLAKNFDTSGAGDETFTWTITQAANNEVDLDFSATNYAGPLEDGAGVNTDIDSFQFNELEENDDWQQGMTDFGILVREYDPSGNNDPNELILDVPRTQVSAQVFVTLGSVETVESGSGTSTQVNPIAVGLAVLDRDAPAVGTENLIVVGGPCANTVAAELLGNPANCGEGFEAGKAMIRAWDKGSTVAILVAGYEATETLGASRVLAQWEDYSLSGPEVEVVVADLNSITVQAPSVHTMDDSMADDSMADETA